MGRKIPAKKHRGVKDPLEQQARRFQSIKGKINAPPKDPEEQPVPRSLTRLFAFQNKTNVTKKKKEKQATRPRDTGPASGVGANPIARLKKLPGESGRGFSLRINSAVKALHDPLEQDYPQDLLEAEDVKGEQMAAQRERRRRKRKAGRGGGAGEGGEEPREKLSRAAKLALKKNAKKEKAAEEARSQLVYERVAFGEVAHAPPALPVRPRHAPRADGAPREARSQLVYERVAFGEVAHAPPALPVRPRHAPRADGAPRPGRRDLLLSALLPGAGKRAVPTAELQRRERARLDVVAAYREHKKLARLKTKHK